jgi:pimeloyl-ACP methyl ester carboxylesterase
VYADINGLTMFYEIRGTSDPAKVPVVLLHGALSATGSSFGTLPDLVARTRQVITVEQQGHGRTADIDRPMPVQAMADDTLALLASLGIGPGRPFRLQPGRGHRAEHHHQPPGSGPQGRARIGDLRPERLAP